MSEYLDAMKPRITSNAIRRKAITIVFAALASTVLALMFAKNVGADEMKQHTHNRVLILAGGGPVGEAWESGVITGLTDEGIDLASAKRIIGTSAGAIVGARLASGTSPADFKHAAISPSVEGPPPETKPGPPDMSFLKRKLDESHEKPAEWKSIRAEIGAWGIKARPIVSEEDFVASYRRRFPGAQWPSTAFECIAIDAESGAMRIWKASDRVPPALAIASSCAVPGIFAPITIEGHRYMDGGTPSVANADLAKGCEAALILAPTVGVGDPVAKSFSLALPGEVQALQTSGCHAKLIVPDAPALKAFGPSIGDERHRAAAFDAGRAQGQAGAGAIASMWKD